MTLAEIISVFRDLADDIGTPPLWSDAVLTFFANEAQNEAVRRARLLEDGTTAATCQIALVNGTPTYDVDRRVIFIRRVKHATIDCPLPKVTQRWLDTVHPGWESHEPGEPAYWLPVGNKQMRLYPTPDADATLHLYVVREPLAPMALGTSPLFADAVDPEIDERYQSRFMDWMLYRCLLQRDKEEKYDPASAKDHLAEFEGEFGKRSSAIDETWINRKHGYDEDEGLF